MNKALHETFRQMHLLAPDPARSRGTLFVTWIGTQTPFKIGGRNEATVTMHYRLVRKDNSEALFDREITTSAGGRASTRPCVLDAAEQQLALADVQCFETEALKGLADAVAPVLTYLFHRLEERFDGRPTLLILDEAWIFLDHPLFAARIRERLKVLRKKNVAVLFATQSLADIAGSPIAPAIIESCPQRILLPNDRAIEPQGRDIYTRFGLNDRQIELISRATPKRHYYLQSARGNRLFELGLGPVALTLCGSSDPGAQARIDAVLAENGREEFAEAFLRDSGLDWAAELVAEHERRNPG